MANITPSGGGVSVDPVIVLANGAQVSSSNPLPVVGGTPSTSGYLNAAVSASSSGDNTVVSGVSSQTVRVFSLAITTASPVDVTLKDGSSTVLGVFQNITSLVLDPMMGSPRYVTTASNAFVINLSSAVACKGTVWYTQA